MIRGRELAIHETGRRWFSVPLRPEATAEEVESVLRGYAEAEGIERVWYRLDRGVERLYETESES